MTTLKLAVLPGDGIGPEVTEEALKVLDVLTHETDFSFEYERADFGGAAIDSSGNPFPESCERLVKASDAVLLGAVGGPKWDALTGNQRPERGLLNLRGSLGVYANLRPAKFFDSLCSASPLRADLTADVDFVTVRELIGGIYFGEPRGITEGPDGRVGQNTMIYSESEILRIGRVAFETAMGRKKKLLSVDKANVLEVQRLWREVMTELGKEYPEVELTHMYVDNCAMQILTPCCANAARPALAAARRVAATGQSSGMPRQAAASWLSRPQGTEVIPGSGPGRSLRLACHRIAIRVSGSTRVLK